MKATRKQHSHSKASPHTNWGTKARCTSTMVMGLGKHRWPEATHHYCLLSPFQQGKTQPKTFLHFAGFTKMCYDVIKRERLTIAGFWLLSVCVYPLPLVLPLSLALGFVHSGVVSNHYLVESFGNGLLQESEIHSLWLWLSCRSSFWPCKHDHYPTATSCK